MRKTLTLGPLATACLLPLLAPASAPEDKGWVTLVGENGPDGWRSVDAAWVVCGDAALDPKNPRKLAAKPGKGVIVNGPRGRAKNLVTKEHFADVEVHVEYVVPKRSNAGVKLMGLYEIQILDSWGKKKVDGNDNGGVYPRAEEKPRYHHIDKGTPPRVNASKRPGEWQTLDIVFRAPRFDENGKKVANARFVKVVLNGEVIHENVEVAYATGAAWKRAREVAKGPLLLQSDHGPVAFRNVRVRPLPPEKE